MTAIDYFDGLDLVQSGVVPFYPPPDNASAGACCKSDDWKKKALLIILQHVTLAMFTEMKHT